LQKTRLWPRFFCSESAPITRKADAGQPYRQPFAAFRAVHWLKVLHDDSAGPSTGAERIAMRFFYD
jgi:hypothetical protein